jgi:glycosyltransferase involved in cell wall biosynthesis
MAQPSKSSRPLVSVVVPTYNYGRLIGETLDSLRAQTCADWECLVVDDGSTDDTAQVVARFAAEDPRFRYLRQPNQRQAVAKNTGLAAARGRYVQFLDADDFIEDEKLERQAAYLEAHPEVDLVYGGVRYFSDPEARERLYSMEEENQPWMPEVSGRGAEVLEPLVRRNIMVINSPLVRRELVERVGPFDPRLPPAEDWDYWLRCALAGARFQFEDIPGTLALVRSHPTSSSRDRKRMHAAGEIIRGKLAALIEDERLLALNHWLRVIEGWHFGLKLAEQGEPFGAAGHLLKSARHEPRWRWKAKLVACALAAPLVSAERLRSLLTTSFTGSLKKLGRGGAGTTGGSGH